MSRSETSNAGLLRRALVANGIFSLICAAVFLAAPDHIASAAGAPPEEIFATGVSLAVFVALLALLATRPEMSRRWVLSLATFVAAMDVLWVAATPLTVAGYTAAGKGMFWSISAVVAVLAFLQIRALVGIFAGRRQARP